MKLLTPIKKYPLVTAGALCLLIGIPLVAYSLSPKRSLVTSTKVLSTDTTKKKMMTEKETKSLLTKIGELIDLPKNELPTVATVTDKFLLPKQTFYEKAENGDRVLIYVEAKKAIIYRPSQHKIIEVAPITAPIATPSSTVESAKTEQQTPTPVTKRRRVIKSTGPTNTIAN